MNGHSCLQDYNIVLGILGVAIYALPDLITRNHQYYSTGTADATYLPARNVLHDLALPSK